MSKISSVVLLYNVKKTPGAINQCRQVSTIIGATKHLDPPPREYYPDGTPRKYRLTSVFYNHDYHWERWTLRRIGMFHVVYVGVWAKEFPVWQAWWMGYPFFVRFYILVSFFSTLGYAIHMIPKFGWYPLRFSKEYMEKTHELARIENCNPITRYLDRRRRERGYNWLPEEWRSWSSSIDVHRPFGAPFSDKNYARKQAEMEPEGGDAEETEET